MLKVPTFVLGGLLILTGILGYLLQDPGLSLKLKGPLADNAKLTLSDGNETHAIDLGFTSSNAAGEQAYWLIERLNTLYSKDSSMMNHLAEQGSEKYGKKSFWYASSRGDTLKSLMQDAENLKNINVQGFERVAIDWAEVDVNSSTVKFVYKNEAGNDGPVTLEISNWTNVDVESPPEDNKLSFGKSPTALIPAFIGLLLILLVTLADAKPAARKHIMHLAVAIGLLCFLTVVKMVGSAVSEMNWLKDEPNGIIQASMLKPLAMLSSAGILLIFVVLCIVSFIQARKEKAAQEKKDSAAKKKSAKDSFKDKGEAPNKEDDSKKVEVKDKADKIPTNSSDKKFAEKTQTQSKEKRDSAKKSSESASKSQQKTNSSAEKNSSDTKKSDSDQKTKSGEEKKKDDSSDSKTRKDAGEPKNLSDDGSKEK